MIINVEPVALLTIYGKQSDEEDYATEHSDSTAKFMLDWRRKEIEGWTWLQPELAHSFMRAQADWKERGGEVFASDCLRTVNVQIDLKVRKPTLAAKPGTSLHGWGMAIDYGTSKLGTINGKKMTFNEFNEHLRKYGWRVHGRAFRSSNHAEAWHIQPTEFRGKPFESNMEVAKILMNEEGPKIEGKEKEIVDVIAKLMKIENLSFTDKIKKIQEMGGLSTDGVIGSITRGYLAILDIKYDKKPSTFKG